MARLLHRLGQPVTEAAALGHALDLDVFEFLDLAHVALRHVVGQVHRLAHVAAAERERLHRAPGFPEPLPQLRVVAKGKWTPDEPEPYLRNPVEPPQPQPGESHQSYAQRYLEWSQPCRTNPDWMRWNGRKVWSGQSVHELRDLLEADQSVENECFIIQPNKS